MSLLACGCIKPTTLPVLSAFQPPNSTHMTMHAAILYTFMTLTRPTHQGAFNSHGSLPTIARLDQEKRFTARNGGPTSREDCFLRPFVQRRREMAHQAPTKSFSKPSPEAAMLPRLSAETHPPPLVPPSLLVQSLSPKDTAGSLTAQCALG